MLFFLWITLQLTFEPTFQMADPNCLRTNPGVLDAEFNVLNRYEMLYDLTKEGVAELADLFLTRFKRAHDFSLIDTGWIRDVVTGIYEFKKSAEKFQLWVKIRRGNETLDHKGKISLYRKYHDAITKINSESAGSVVGLYLSIPDEDPKSELKAIKTFFTSRKNLTYGIGDAHEDCLKQFKITNAAMLFRSLHLISCKVDALSKPSPEESADEVIRTCNEIKEIARSTQITAEILCIVEYPSYFKSEDGVVIGVSQFQRFWCKIVQELIRNQSNTQIMFTTAFNSTPDEYKGNYTILNDKLYHSGWWRRRHTTSFDAGAFVEKVEELEGGREPGNCSAECNICSSRKECCDGRFCYNDLSFQPFENGVIRKVCQSFQTSCAPRPPLAPHTQFDIIKSNISHTKFDISKSKGSVVTPVHIAVLILCIVLVVVVVMAFVNYNRRKAKNVFSHQELQNFYHGATSSADGQFTGHLESHEIIGGLPYDNNLELANSSFEIYEDKILGCGKFGLVVKGRIGNDDVAVKTTVPGVQKVYLKALTLELKVLMYLGRHENIVNLIAAHASQLSSGKLYLFLELCPMGNLLEVLRSHSDLYNDKEDHCEAGNAGNITSKDLLHWSVQIACAMEHLADKKVIHADIAARNILVFSKSKVKLTDFGLSRRLYEYLTYFKTTQEPLPWRHMSVEALEDHCFSLQSDIWSFAVTLWEIYSLGKVPYSGHSASADFAKRLTAGLRLERPEYAHQTIYKIMTSCWSIEALMRPPISLVHSRLKSAFAEFFKSQVH